MKLFNTLAFVTLSTLSLFANDTAPLEEIVQKGQTSTKLLMETLGKNMQMHMKHGGPMEALDFCSQEAFNLTEKVNTQLPSGVSVRRISLQTRNPVNAPTPDEETVLQNLVQLQKENKTLPKHIIEKVGENTYKFYKPLVIEKPACLKCHGDVENQTLKAEILNRYPQDKAMNYKMGDLRGAVVTTVKEN